MLLDGRRISHQEQLRKNAGLHCEQVLACSEEVTFVVVVRILFWRYATFDAVFTNGSLAAYQDFLFRDFEGA